MTGIELIVGKIASDDGDALDQLERPWMKRRAKATGMSSFTGHCGRPP